MVQNVKNMFNLRKLVLSSFRTLHRTRMKVFAGDERALAAARLQINDEYKKHKHTADQQSIQSMIQFANDVEKELRTQVIQAREVKPGVFEANISADTLKLDNIPFNECAVPEGGIPGAGRRDRPDQPHTHTRNK